jgi:hypothetical protein
LVKMGVIPVLFEQTAGGDPSLEQAVSLLPFWNGLLILAPERARRVSWGVAPNPAKVGLAVRKYPQGYSNRVPRRT